MAKEISGRTGNIVMVADNDEFFRWLKVVGDALVVVDFYTSWCKPCKEMNAVITSIAPKFPDAYFLKVDAEKCLDIAVFHKITGVPTFVFYQKCVILDQFNGRDPHLLEDKVRYLHDNRKQLNSILAQNPQTFQSTLIKAAALIEKTNPKVVKPTPTAGSSNVVYGNTNVAPYIYKEHCKCFNDLFTTPFQNFLVGNKLVSGKGTGRLILVYVFTEPVRLHHFTLRASRHNGPKRIKMFVNLPKILDFETAAATAPSQILAFTENDLNGVIPFELLPLHFQTVCTLQVLVAENLSLNRKVEIEELTLFGSPIAYDITDHHTEERFNALTKAFMAPSK